MVEDYQALFVDFWEDLVVKDGVLDLDSVARELADYRNLMDAYSKVIYQVTGGVASKSTTSPDAVIDIYFEKLHEEYDRGYEEGQEDLRQEYAVQTDT